jgi:histidyl-tRNA synthetase
VGEELGAQSSMSGGGRYDGLVRELGGGDVAGVGFGAGLERLHLALEEAGSEPVRPEVDVFFASDDNTDRERMLTVMAELRRRGLACDADYAGRSLKGQLTQAGRVGARTTVVVAGGRATLRRRGEADVEVALDEVAERVLP